MRSPHAMPILAVVVLACAGPRPAEVTPTSASGAGLVVVPDSAGPVYLESRVTERPERLSNPPLEYPTELRGQRIQGSVLLQCVIDTLGRVEPGSVKVVSYTHPGFIDAARRALARLTYRAGRVNGRRVRVQAMVPFNWSILPQ
jgi:TonB family protein